MQSIKIKWNTRMPTVEKKCGTRLGSFHYNKEVNGVAFFTYISDSLTIWQFCDNITATEDGRIVKCVRENDYVLLNICNWTEYAVFVGKNQSVLLQARELLKNILEGALFAPINDKLKD